MLDEIRKVTPKDLLAVTEVEAICFPAAEAAGKESFEARIRTFPDSFFVGIKDGKIVGFINGAVVNERTIRDEMYEDTDLHDPEGAYQSVFGLDVIPECQHQGYACELMRHLIEDAKQSGRKGLILTCKDRLIGFYEQFGYHNMGVSESVHGGAVWNDMILEFDS